MPQTPSTIDFWPTPQTQNVPDYPLPDAAPDADGNPPLPTDPGVPTVTNPALITSDQATGSFYTEGRNDGLYEWDMGLLQVPVAGINPQCEIIATHQPLARRVFEWTVERPNQAPSAPSWLTNNPNEVLIEKEIYPPSPAMGPDGSLVWRRSGRYVYALLQAPGDQDQLFAGVPPYMAISPNAMNVQPGDFDQNLSDTSSTVPQGFVPPTGLG